MGSPPNAIITENTCNALAATPEEKEYLMSKMFPPMIDGGFTTVTITSVIIASVFAKMFLIVKAISSTKAGHEVFRFCRIKCWLDHRIGAYRYESETDLSNIES